MGASVTELDVIVTLDYYTNPPHLSIVQRDLKLKNEPTGMVEVSGGGCVCFCDRCKSVKVCLERWGGVVCMAVT